MIIIWVVGIPTKKQKCKSYTVIYIYIDNCVKYNDKSWTYCAIDELINTKIVYCRAYLCFAKVTSKFPLQPLSHPNCLHPIVVPSINWYNACSKSWDWIECFYYRRSTKISCDHLAYKLLYLTPFKISIFDCSFQLPQHLQVYQWNIRQAKMFPYRI